MILAHRPAADRVQGSTPSGWGSERVLDDSREHVAEAPDVRGRSCTRRRSGPSIGEDARRVMDAVGDLDRACLHWRSFPEERVPMISVRKSQSASVSIARADGRGTPPPPREIGLECVLLVAVQDVPPTFSRNTTARSPHSRFSVKRSGSALASTAKPKSLPMRLGSRGCASVRDWRPDAPRVKDEHAIGRLVVVARRR